MTSYFEAIRSQGADDSRTPFVTLYTAGVPAGQAKGRADYWSLSNEQARRLGEQLIAAAGFVVGGVAASGGREAPDTKEPTDE